MELEKTIALGGVAATLGVLGLLLGKTWGTSRRFQRGLQSYEAKQYPAAIAAFEATIARQPSNDLARLLLGEALVAEGKFPEAIATFKALIDRSPKNVDGYLSLGKLLRQQGQVDAAIAQFQTAATIKPKRFAEPHAVLGLALRDRGEIAGAIAALETALEIYRRQGETTAIAALERELKQLQAAPEDS